MPRAGGGFFGEREVEEVEIAHLVVLGAGGQLGDLPGQLGQSELVRVMWMRAVTSSLIGVGCSLSAPGPRRRRRCQAILTGPEARRRFGGGVVFTTDLAVPLINNEAEWPIRPVKIQ